MSTSRAPTADSIHTDLPAGPELLTPFGPPAPTIGAAATTHHAASQDRGAAMDQPMRSRRLHLPNWLLNLWEPARDRVYRLAGRRTNPSPAEFRRMGPEKTIAYLRSIGVDQDIREAKAREARDRGAKGH